jgi:hypothetical protein
MSIWRTIGLVAGREVRERGRSKAFLISTGLIMALAVGVAISPRHAVDHARRTSHPVVGAKVPGDTATLSIGALPAARSGLWSLAHALAKDHAAGYGSRSRRPGRA